MDRLLFTADHNDYRQVVRDFVDREVSPNRARWDQERLIDRQVWLAAGKQGIIGLGVPDEYGGGGEPDYRYQVVVMEELARAGAASLASSFSLQDNIIIPYVRDLGSEQQKHRWLTGMASGELVGAIAMTEPGAGSDLQGVRTNAVRDGGDWVINGQKTFITSGIHADLVIVVAAHRPGRRRARLQPDRRRDRHTGLHPRPQARQGRPARPGHRRAVLRRGPGAGRDLLGEPRDAASCT